jgi:hypothetical protein
MEFTARAHVFRRTGKQSEKGSDGVKDEADMTAQPHQMLTSIP